MKGMVCDIDVLSYDRDNYSKAPPNAS